jgi:hypothetical protein
MTGKAPQTNWKTLLVRPVERGGHAAFERVGPLLNYDSRPGQRDPCGNPSTDQRIGGDQTKPVCEPHIGAVRGTGLSSCLQGQVETIHGDDGDPPAPLSSRRLARGTWHCAITRDELQKLLDKKAHSLSESVVTHLRFRLRSIFELALSEGAVERNPATSSIRRSTASPAARGWYSLLRISTP